MSLATKKCGPCGNSTPALNDAEIADLLKQIEGWHLDEERKLAKVLKFDNFQQAMDLAVKIADIANKENHHPDLIVRWGELRIIIWTHTIKALSENDFILAAKIDRAASGA